MKETIKEKYSDSHYLQLTSYIFPAIYPDVSYYPIGTIIQLYCKYTKNVLIMQIYLQIT